MTEDEDILSQLGLTEADLLDLMARGQRRRILLVEVPFDIYSRAEEIQHMLRGCEIGQEEASARWESEVFPHLGIRPGEDYDPRSDTIQLRVRHVERLLPN